MARFLIPLTPPSRQPYLGAMTAPATFPPQSLANLRPYNHVTAKLAGQRSAQVRRERGQARRQARLAAQVERDAEPDARLLILSEQIARTRRALNDTKLDYCPACERSGLAGKDRAALVRALCSLLDQQRIARGEPLPGSRRPRDPASVSSQPPMPVMLDDTLAP